MYCNNMDRNNEQPPPSKTEGGGDSPELESQKRLISNMARYVDTSTRVIESQNKKISDLEARIATTFRSVSKMIRVIAVISLLSFLAATDRHYLGLFAAIIGAFGAIHLSDKALDHISKSRKNKQ